MAPAAFLRQYDISLPVFVAGTSGLCLLSRYYIGRYLKMEHKSHIGLVQVDNLLKTI